MASKERTSYCLPCDRVIVWRSWATWQAHLRSVEHRECVLAPRPLPPERVRPADVDDPLYGLAAGESVVFRRPDGRWIGLAALGSGESLRVEDTQQGLVIERLGRHLGEGSPEPKRLCLRCRLILDPVIFGRHYTSREHRARKEPDLEAEPVAPLAGNVPSPRPGAPGEQPERLFVTMAPITLTVSDAARVIGLSKSTISGLARNGTIPSLRIGTRVLIPVKSLEEWVDGRLADEADRFGAAWVRLGDYGRSASAPPSRRRGRHSRPSRYWWLSCTSGQLHRSIRAESRQVGDRYPSAGEPALPAHR